jgi:hypothetical protein
MQGHKDVAAPAAPEPARAAPAPPASATTAPRRAPSRSAEAVAARSDALAGTLARAVSQRGGPLLQRMPYVVQAGYMSGDMFGIAAAMVVSPGTGVVILKETDPEFADREEQSALFKAFYETTLRGHGLGAPAIAKRVKTVNVEDTRTVYKDLTDDKKKKHDRVYDAGVRLSAGLAESDKFIRPGQATTRVGEAYERNQATATTSMRTAWRGTGVGPSEDQIRGFLTAKKIVRGKKYALLWVRLSAKNKIGGAHPELDTSIQGVRDLKIAAVERLRREPVIIGDNPGDANLLTGAIDLVEFWKQGVFATFSGLNSRLAQLRLFEYLARNGYDLISIGMRSGAMEAPALLGIPTTYIEERGNKQAVRMQKWIGKVPGWSQAQVEELPTRTGRRAQFGATGYLGLDSQLTAAIQAVRDHTGGDIDTVHERLEACTCDSEQDSYEDFIEASISDWSGFLPPAVTSYATYVSDHEGDAGTGAAFAGKLRGLMRTWHAARLSWLAAYNALEELEQTIAPLVGKPEETVHDRLRELEAKALNNDIGRAAFVDAALTKLESRPPAAPALSAALAGWRSVFNGKSGLKAGFTRTDLVRVLTPILERELNRRAPMLVEIDNLARMVPGTTANVVRRFEGTCESVDAFRNACYTAFVAGLRLKLGLPATAPVPLVQERLKAFRTTTPGQAWQKAFDDKTATLYKQLFVD